MRGVKMTKVSDRSYHEARARDEMTRAEAATEPAIANVHRELATLHRRKLIALADSPQLSLNLLPNVR
jgi:hypothetical protein